MKPPHGNSHENFRPHHLYAIDDTEEKNIYKLGVSYKPIGEDGLSSRIRDQVNLFNNIVGWVRFVARIIIKGINGKKRAEEIEKEHVEAYLKKYGKKPRGNRQ